MMQIAMLVGGLARFYALRGDRVGCTLLIGCVAFFPKSSFGDGPDVISIIQKSVAANQTDWNAAPGYSFEETDRSPKGSKTYRVAMIDGSPYQTLIAVNGKPLAAGERTEQEERLKKTTESRKAETSSERKARVAKYEAERSQDHVLMQQLTEAFQFSLEGTQTINGSPVYVLKAVPRKGYRPPNLDSQILPGMQGELWIDAKTFQWVKVTARVISPVAIEGILAQVEPGTYFELEKAPVAEGIWLPQHFVMKSHSKIFFLVGHNTQADETYFDYQKAKLP